MKKITLFIVLTIVLSSCSNDDDGNKEFFNLKVGNSWVYKKYGINEEGVGKYSGQTDTVKIEGTQIFEGKTFFVITHTDSFWVKKEFLKVDELGHLIYSTGIVLHPGADKTFTQVRPLPQLPGDGIITYASEDVTDIKIEEKNYSVFPYVGNIVPNPNVNILEGKATFEYYKRGLGFIARRYRYYSSQSAVEYRLVSYDLK